MSDPVVSSLIDKFDDSHPYYELNSDSKGMLSLSPLESPNGHDLKSETVWNVSNLKYKEGEQIKSKFIRYRINNNNNKQDHNNDSSDFAQVYYPKEEEKKNTSLTKLRSYNDIEISASSSLVEPSLSLFENNTYEFYSSCNNMKNPYLKFTFKNPVKIKRYILFSYFCPLKYAEHLKSWQFFAKIGDKDTEIDRVDSTDRDLGNSINFIRTINEQQSSKEFTLKMISNFKGTNHLILRAIWFEFYPDENNSEEEKKDDNFEEENEDYSSKIENKSDISKITYLRTIPILITFQILISLTSD